jgi:hypothetical protein
MTRRHRSLVELSLRLCALLGTMVPASTLFAQAQPMSADTVVLRVTSPRGEEVTFSGVVTMRDARTERRLDNMRTPFELRLPTQNIDARFTAADGKGLGGEIISYKAGKQHGLVVGQMYSGTVALYYDSGDGFGFGPRRKRGPKTLP